jgi:hypothetical protein
VEIEDSREKSKSFCFTGNIMRPMTPNLAERARALRAAHHSWRSIALQLDVSEWACRCECDEAYRAHRQQLKGEQPKRPRKARPRRLDISNAVRHEVRSSTPHGPPPDVLAERDLARALQLNQTPVARLLGDPLPGRSALDQRSKEFFNEPSGSQQEVGNVGTKRANDQADEDRYRRRRQADEAGNESDDHAAAYGEGDSEDRRHRALSAK